MKPSNTSRSFLGSILFFVFLVLYTPLHAIAFLALCPFLNIKKRQTVAFAWTTICIRTLGLLCKLHYKLEGLEHLPHTGGIIMAKHQSAWETLAIPSVLQPRPLCIVYKQELHYIPFFGWGLKMLNMAPINRSKGAAAFEQIKQAALQHLQNGAWMMFFPEGTRVPVGQTRRYKSGGARLALATGAPIIPVALDAGEFWPRHGFWKRQGTITLRFGPPISPAGHTLESLNTAVETWIEGEMKLISPHRYETTSVHNTHN